MLVCFPSTPQPVGHYNRFSRLMFLFTLKIRQMPYARRNNLPVSVVYFTEPIGMLSRLLIRLIQRIVITFGKTVDPQTPWMKETVIGTEVIGKTFYRRHAETAGLRIAPPTGREGLMHSMSQLNGPHFDAAQVHPAIHDFYTETARWKFDISARWNPWLKPFVGLFMGMVAARVEQLNFPRSEKDITDGMSSELFPITDAEGKLLYTCWLRCLPSSGKVIYSGFYTPAVVPVYDGGIVKTTFPLPDGNVTVILYPEALPDGSFRFISKGNKHGGPGYYRVHKKKNGKLKMLMLPLREALHLIPQPNGTIAATHRFTLWNVPVVTLAFGIYK